jgi:hypothetical protein
MSRTLYKQRQYELKASNQMTKEGHLREYMYQSKYRAKEKDLPYDLTYEHLASIATDMCPVFKTPFVWGRYTKERNPQTPSLDRVIPELGYVQGNVVFISDMANRIKQEFTENEMYAVADWLHDKRKEVLDAFKDRPAPVSINGIGKGKGNTELGAVHGAGPWEDCDGSHHHTGEPEGEDSCDSAKAGCRICMGTGMRKMATLETFYSSQVDGDALCSPEEFAKRLRCICYQRGKSSVASRQLAFEGF